MSRASGSCGRVDYVAENSEHAQPQQDRPHDDLALCPTIHVEAPDSQSGNTVVAVAAQEVPAGRGNQCRPGYSTAGNQTSTDPAVDSRAEPSGWQMEAACGSVIGAEHRGQIPRLLGDVAPSELGDSHAGIVVLIGGGRLASDACRRGLGACALLAVAPLVGCGTGSVRTDVVIVNAGEPQNPLIPTNTNDSNGGRIIDRLFAGLMSYDDKGTPALEVARSIETTDDVNYRITLKPGWTFSDGSPVTAHSFVDAWNYGALATNAQLQQSFFSPIAGFDEVAAAKPTATTMSGLQVVNDHEFTVRLKGPTIDFTLRLGFSPFYPLPDVALKDMAAFGQHPIGNGPYRLADERQSRPGSTTSNSTW